MPINSSATTRLPSTRSTFQLDARHWYARRHHSRTCSSYHALGRGSLALKSPVLSTVIPDGLVSSRRRWAMTLMTSRLYNEPAGSISTVRHFTFYGTSLLHHDLIEYACYSSIGPRSPRHLGIGFHFLCVEPGHRQNGAHGRRP